MDKLVDISYSIPEKELQGRRCLKNMKTGKTFLFQSEMVGPGIPGYEQLEVLSEVPLLEPKVKPRPPVILPKEAVTPLEDHVVIKPKAKPRAKWKNNAA
jgi:hypothetical protein